MITTACDRANQITVYAERLAKRGDVGLEVVFFDDPVRPDPSHQLILVDDPATAVDQDEQRVEGATPDRDRCPAGNELAAMGYHLEATEFQGRYRFALAVHALDCTAPFQDFSAWFRTGLGSAPRFRPRQ